MPLPENVVHLQALLDNMKEVLRLLEIHGQITGKGPGRKHDVQILHKSAVVLLVACWEAYVEDLVEAALDYMILHAKSHTVFPQSVLERVASRNAGVSAWTLAGEGWKQALRDSLADVLARTTGSMNTPKTAQVDELFKKAVGISSISKTWRWKGRTTTSASKSLDDLVTLRGSIAHRVTSSKAVRKKDVVDAREFISRLAALSSNHVCKFVEQQTGGRPWSEVVFRGTG